MGEEDEEKAVAGAARPGQWETILRPWTRFVSLRGHGRHLFANAYQDPALCCPTKKGTVQAPSSGCHPH
jgi:hypothetical protein